MCTNDLFLQGRKQQLNFRPLPLPVLILQSRVLILQSVSTFKRLWKFRKEADFVEEGKAEKKLFKVSSQGFGSET
ncbi:hypothetical protein L6452_16783 [Arctium lappa]|uniref:Uncharacterized protein n=1 Tax=Arctium lappa TaxID=4217 RepID=A0ACB9C1N2_ARCLA|nr:hypothetical protein L6452_16783 [Arctium lappa]